MAGSSRGDRVDPDDAETIKRRIEAARILRGISQAELNRRLAADGLGTQEAGRVERGELPLSAVRRWAMTRALGVPERWFLEPDVDVVVGLRSPPAEEALKQAFDRLAPELLEAARGLAQEGEEEPGREGGADR